MKVELFVPVVPTTAAEQCRQALVDRFGGATSYPAMGHWRSATGETISEPVTVETIYTDSADGIEEIARQYKVAGAQEAVLYVIDSSPHFV